MKVCSHNNRSDEHINHKLNFFPSHITIYVLNCSEPRAVRRKPCSMRERNWPIYFSHFPNKKNHEVCAKNIAYTIYSNWYNISLGCYHIAHLSTVGGGSANVGCLHEFKQVSFRIGCMMDCRKDKVLSFFSSHATVWFWAGKVFCRIPCTHT